MFKICPCGKEFKTYRSIRKYCSIKCNGEYNNAAGFQKNHKPFEGSEKTHYKIGSIPWNKGKHSPKIQGEKNYHWKGGLPKCPGCQKILSTRKTKKCNHCSILGKNNNSWKGGVTPENEKIRKSEEYKLVRGMLKCIS